MNNEYETFTLINGMRVMYIKNDTNLSSIQVCTKVGSIDESKKLHGASHYLEHMLFKGTKKKTKSTEILEDIYNKGAYINAFTSKNSTCFLSKINSKYLKNVIDILSDMLLNSTLTIKAFDIEKAVVIEEINQGLDEPIRFLINKLYSLIFDKHVLSSEIAGTPESILALKRDDIIKYYKKYYNASNMVVIICSNLSIKDVKKYLNDSYFIKFKPLVIKQKNCTIPQQKIPRFSIDYRNLEQIHLMIGFKVCNMYSEDRFGIDIISSILGGNMNSRLFIDLREKNGLSYQIEVISSYYEDYGDFMIYTSFDKDSLYYKNEMDTNIDYDIDKLFGNTNTNTKSKGVLSIILDNLYKLKNEAINKKNLDNIKGYIIGNTEISVENTSNLVGYYGDQFLFNQEIHTINDLKEKYNSITSKNIIKLSKKYFDFNLLNISILGNTDLKKLNNFITEKYL